MAGPGRPGRKKVRHEACRPGPRISVESYHRMVYFRQRLGLMAFRDVIDWLIDTNPSAQRFLRERAAELKARESVEGPPARPARKDRVFRYLGGKPK